MPERAERLPGSDRERVLLLPARLLRPHRQLNHSASISIFIAAALALSACGDSDPGFVGEVPTNPDALRPWLANGDYREWTAEPMIHPSQGPHGDVRTYFNAPLEGSLDQSNQVHRLASAAVKEMYVSGVLTGWSVMVKTEERAGADTWYWYELLDREPDTRPIEGQGHSACTGCHQSGVDYVQSAWRP